MAPALNCAAVSEPARKASIVDTQYSFFLAVVPQKALATIVPIVAKISSFLCLLNERYYFSFEYLILERIVEARVRVRTAITS